MAHYAKLDENNNVLEVVVIANEDCLDENGVECEENGRRMCEALTGHAKWKKTSYNTRGGIYYETNTNQPSEDQTKAFRLNYAGKNYRYDETLDSFIQNETYKTFSMMQLNIKTGNYEIPDSFWPTHLGLQLETYPEDIYYKRWFWDDNEKIWKKVKRTDPINYEISWPILPPKEV
jgi:hypothetical protein